VGVGVDLVVDLVVDDALDLSATFVIRVDGKHPALVARLDVTA